ncbi:hypothetical protein D3C73_472740 [compost metagenome]
MDHLALQIGKRYPVVIGDADRSDTGCGEIFQHGGAKATGADHQNTGGFQLLLAGSADFRQQDMAFVTLDLVRGECRLRQLRSLVFHDRFHITTTSSG